MIIDAHLHLTEEDVENNIIGIMEENDIYGLVAATNPVEAKWLDKLAAATENIFPTYGLHPWYCNQYSLAEMVPYLDKADCIGEIGMDIVWCDIDLKLQERVFVGQLDIAEKKQCPVILHTKGQEEKIAKIIADYTMPVLLHWYSCQDFLDMYIEIGCYFTIGPDVRTNKAVQQIVKELPLDRLLVESDGLSSLEWIGEKIVTVKDLPAFLMDSMAYVAKEKGVSFGEVKEQMAQNLTLFLSGKAGT